MIAPEELQAESLLDEIHRQRDATREAQERAERERKEVQALRKDLSARLQAIDDERREILLASKREAAEELEGLQEELRRLRGRLKLAAQPLDSIKDIEEEIKIVENAVTEPVAREVPDVAEPAPPLKLGDRVLLRMLGSEGVISEMTNDHVEVQIGKLRVRTRADELVPISVIDVDEEEQAAAVKRSRSDAVRKTSAGQAPPMELDVRGMVVDDALMEMERRLDAAFLAGMPFVRVIHGKGTGRLRQAIRLNLENNPYTATFEPGGAAEGGDGVTVVHLATM